MRFWSTNSTGARAGRRAITVLALALLMLAGCSSPSSPPAEEAKPAAIAPPVEPPAEPPAAKETEPPPAATARTTPKPEPAARPVEAAPKPKPAAQPKVKPQAMNTDIYNVRFKTSKGDVVVQINRAWAPIGADHFRQLVTGGYYDGARFFRIVPGFVVQFGLAGDPALTAQWNEQTLRDDPVTQSNLRGTLTYATRGPNTRTTQLFINLGDNTFLDGQGFSPFGKVIEGMEIVDALNPEYGERPNQGLISRQGNAYLQAQFPALDYVQSAAIE